MGALAAATLLALPLAAGGFNTCALPQKDVRAAGGVERPISRAYDAVCIAVLPPASCGGRPCPVRACLVPDNLKSCPNGDLLMFNAETIQPFLAQSVKPITPDELAAMNRALDAEAKKLAARWTDNGRVPLSPAAMTVLRNQACQLAAYGNPDVRCVPR